MPERATVATHSAITVVSAFSSGKGVTIGIDVPCIVTADLRPREIGTPEINVRGKIPDTQNLVVVTVKRAMKYLGVRIPHEKSVFLTVDSEIPTAVGLKSSSAVSVAVTKAIFEIFSRQDLMPAESQKILQISCEASIEAGASLTGAFDDATASLLGGLVFSDNLKFRLLRHESLNPELGSAVRILVPINRNKLTSTLSLETYRKYRALSLEAIEYAQRGVLVQAMLLNSIIHSVIHHYSMQPIISSLAEGASASGITGKGPAVAAICRNNRISNRVTRRWNEENRDCRIITASVTEPRKS